jgi:hypothetical protein
MAPSKFRWMVCDQLGRNKGKPCLFDEHTALRMGDPPRCIRHGALLFGDSSLDGNSRAEADRVIRDRWEQVS